jgi:hypothetical protein
MDRRGSHVNAPVENPRAGAVPTKPTSQTIVALITSVRGRWIK